MRRLLANWLLISWLACGCAAGLAAPAALASGSGGVTVSTPTTAAPGGSATQPSFNLNNAGAAALQTTTVSSGATSTTSSSGGLSTGDAVIIAVVAVLVLGGIALLVRSDAHRHLAQVAHGGHDDPLAGQRAHSGSKAVRRPRKLKPAERKRRKRGRAR